MSLSHLGVLAAFGAGLLSFLFPRVSYRWSLATCPTWQERASLKPKASPRRAFGDSARPLLRARLCAAFHADGGRSFPCGHRLARLPAVAGAPGRAAAHPLWDRAHGTLADPMGIRHHVWCSQAALSGGDQDSSAWPLGQAGQPVPAPFSVQS